jgi:esterase FrsA
VRCKAQFVIVPCYLAFALASAAFAQQRSERSERTLDEIKAEAIHRAENGMYPLIGLDPGDVREALSSIETRDKDEWAAAFMAVADRYMAEGKALEAAGQYQHLRESSVLMPRQSRRFWRMPAFGTRR